MPEHTGEVISSASGALLGAKREGKRKAVSPVRNLLDSLRFRVDPETRERVIRLAGESL